MTNIRPFFFLLVAKSILGATACGANQPVATPTITVQFVPPIFPCTVPSSGVFAGKWGAPGTGDGQFNQPVGVAASPDGGVYVADSGNHRIQKFTSDGVFVTKWGTKANGT